VITRVRKAKGARPKRATNIGLIAYTSKPAATSAATEAPRSVFDPYLLAERASSALERRWRETARAALHKTRSALG
jgi:hypothetical protein